MARLARRLDHYAARVEARVEHTFGGERGDSLAHLRGE
jgi:hypothetical protein